MILVMSDITDVETWTCLRAFTMGLLSLSFGPCLIESVSLNPIVVQADA